MKKFRAFDKLQNKFLHPYPDGFTILGETTCFDIIGQQLKESTPNKTTLERLNDVVITQAIGIKDVNGLDIYEGDIIEDAAGRLWDVVYYERHAGFVASWIKEGVNNSYKTFDSFKLCQLPFEIKGNIFNPLK
jgi:uncharacterized phage protein (TIGR01671 family)